MLFKRLAARSALFHSPGLRPGFCFQQRSLMTRTALVGELVVCVPIIFLLATRRCQKEDRRPLNVDAHTNANPKDAAQRFRSDTDTPAGLF